MTRRLHAALLLALLCATPALAQNPPAVDDLLHRLEQLGVEAKVLQNPSAPQLPPVVVVPQGGSIQSAINAAAPGTIIALVPGGLYRESVIVAKPSIWLTLTTKDCALPDRVVLPGDVPVMASLQGAAGQSYGIWVMANGFTVRCLNFLPTSAGEMVRVGDSQSAVLGDVPDGVTVRQNYFKGDPVTGQKRAIAANGSHLLIHQNAAEDIWVNQQDSQCVAVFSTPGPVTISHNVFGCGSENIIIGGVPPAGPEFLPSDVLTEWNVLYKPLAWKGPTGTSPPAKYQVKNLYEVKLGRRIMARHNLMVNNWPSAQPGMAVLATMATNGPCGAWCVMEDVGLEENIVWRVAGGVSLTGYQYLQVGGSGSGASRFSVKGNLFWVSKAEMGGAARVFQFENEPKDVTIDHNTIIYDGSNILTASYGVKWPSGVPVKVAGGPVTGFRYTNNLARHGLPPPSTASYGLMTPEGNAGVNLGTYFPGAVVNGNVFGGATSAQITRYNLFSSGVPPTNVTQSWVDFDAQVNTTKCPTSTLISVADGPAGADCAHLPWALWDLLPASAGGR